MTDFDIRRLDAGDVDAVDRLRKANSATLGFMPHEALLAHLQTGWGLGAECSDGSLAAYILFANRTKDVRIVHVCVLRLPRAQGEGLGEEAHGASCHGFAKSRATVAGASLPA